MEENSLPKPSALTWVEQDSGKFIPAKNYDNSVTKTEGEALNDIDWRKAKIVK